MTTTMISNTQTTRQLFLEQEKTKELLNTKNDLLKIFSKQLKKAKDDRQSFEFNLGTNDLEIRMFKKLQENNEVKIKFFKAILQKDLRNTLIYMKKSNALLDDFLTDIVFSDIKTGILVDYAEITKLSYEVLDLNIKHLLDVLTRLQKLGQPRYWN